MLLRLIEEGASAVCEMFFYLIYISHIALKALQIFCEH